VRGSKREAGRGRLNEGDWERGRLGERGRQRVKEGGGERGPGREAQSRVKVVMVERSRTYQKVCNT
jgi:hypothetical protein